MYNLSFLKENLERNLCDIQKEVPIKSANSFLYEYWNVFFYLYSKKLLEKFKKTRTGYESMLLDSISMNNIFKKDVDNFFQLRERDNNKDTINLNNNITLNNLNNNSQLNISPPTNIKSSLFQPQNNNINLGNNYIYPSFPGMLPNPQNELFLNQIPRIPSIPNNLNVSPFFGGPKLQNSFGNEIRPNLYGDIENINNLDQPNVPFFQIPIQNTILAPLPNNLVSTNNIIPNSIPNKLMITNSGTNINANSNINLNKNINNIINVNNKNTVNNNINNCINKNPNSNIKNENNKNSQNINNTKNPTLNSSIKKDNNPKIKFTSKTFNTSTNNINNNNGNKINEQEKKPSTPGGVTPLPPQAKKRPTPLFNITESTLQKDKEQKSSLTCKKRKRFLKNNKLVFVQLAQEKDKDDDNNDKNGLGNEENKNEDSVDSEKVSEMIQKNTKPRGSKYRGVSKNGSQWQVLIMVKKKKRYLGSFSNEEEAARAYDKVALQHHGIKAKTNYDYTKEEVAAIIAGPKLLKLD